MDQQNIKVLTSFLHHQNLNYISFNLGNQEHATEEISKQEITIVTEKSKGKAKKVSRLLRKEV